MTEARKRTEAAGSRCPFCGASVDEELLRLGGACPACLIEIPGDEAATDPGAEAVAAEQAVEAKVERKRSAKRILAYVLIVVLGGLFILLIRPDEIVRIQLERGNFLGMDAHVDPDLPVSNRPEQPATDQPEQRRRARPLQTSVSAPEDDSARELNPAPPEEWEQLAPGELPQIGTGGPKSTLKGIVLSDPDQIQKAVDSSLARMRDEAQACYESRKSQKSSLTDSWTLSFRLATDGRPGDVDLVANDGNADATFEKCVVAELKALSFPALKQDFWVTNRVPVGSYR